MEASMAMDKHTADTMRQWIKDARKGFRGDNSEWARAWRRALSQFEQVVDAAESDRPREEILRIGD